MIIIITKYRRMRCKSALHYLLWERWEKSIYYFFVIYPLLIYGMTIFLSMRCLHKIVYEWWHYEFSMVDDKNPLWKDCKKSCCRSIVELSLIAFKITSAFSFILVLDIHQMKVIIVDHGILQNWTFVSISKK